MIRHLIALLGLASTIGCAANKVNPSFDVSRDSALKIINHIQDNAKPLDRPLVIVGGFRDPGFGPYIERSIISARIDDRRIIAIPMAFEPDFDHCRAKLIAKVQRQFPNQQVDVIGLSMGGLVARYAAAPIEGKPRLEIARLFTVSSPHTGAVLARMPTLDRKVIDMRPGSEFLANLAKLDANQNYELIPYVRLGDEFVGEQYAAPKGSVAWWLDTPPLEPAHIGAGTDPRIVADILLRLRDEPPLTHEPRAPIPKDAS